MLRISIATTSDDPRNPRSWSGTPHSILRALTASKSATVDILGPLDPGLRLLEGARKLYFNSRRERYLWEREERVLRHYRRQFRRKLETQRPDVVLSLGTVAAAALPSGIPYVVYVDSTFDLNVDYYPNMSDVCARSRRLGDEVDRRAFQQARHVVVTSQWAAENVEQHYGVKRDRISVVPIGAQHVASIDEAALDQRAAARLQGPMKLFWMGVEWGRKGGDIAVEIAKELHRRGVPVELNIAGCVPPPDFEGQPFIRNHGFLDRRTRQSDLEELFLSSFALLLPSRAENTSVVIADAASFGLPTFASDTGGMRTMIQNGANGEVMAPGAPPSAYADAILAYRANPDAYRALVRATRRRFKEALSWDVAISRILDICAAAPDKASVAKNAEIGPLVLTLAR